MRHDVVEPQVKRVRHDMLADDSPEMTMTPQSGSSSASSMALGVVGAPSDAETDTTLQMEGVGEEVAEHDLEKFVTLIDEVSVSADDMKQLDDELNALHNKAALARQKGNDHANVVEEDPDWEVVWAPMFQHIE